MSGSHQQANSSKKSSTGNYLGIPASFQCDGTFNCGLLSQWDFFGLKYQTKMVGFFNLLFFKLKYVSCCALFRELSVACCAFVVA
jgi:hypothetical protein